MAVAETEPAFSAGRLPAGEDVGGKGMLHPGCRRRRTRQAENKTRGKGRDDRTRQVAPAE